MTDSMSPSASLSIVLPLPVPVGDSGMMADCRCWWYRDRPLDFTVEPPPANQAGEWQTGSHDEWAALVLRLWSPTLGGVRDALVSCIEGIWNQAPAVRIEVLLEECARSLEAAKAAQGENPALPAALVGESFLQPRRPIAERGIPLEGAEFFGPWTERMWWKEGHPTYCAAGERPVDDDEDMVSGSLRAWADALLAGPVAPRPGPLAARLWDCSFAASFCAPAEVLQHALDGVIAGLDRLVACEPA